MLTLEDCIGLSDLTEEEILAIAEHEHIPEMAALEMGSCLVRTPEGERRIEAMILDDIVAAKRRGDACHVAALRVVLRQFEAHHSEACRAS